MSDVLASFWNLVPVTLVQGTLYAFVALAVTRRLVAAVILKFAMGHR